MRKAGKDVYCEKGWTTTVASAKRMRRAVKEAEAIMQLGHQGRQLAAADEGRTLIEEGTIGEVTLVNTGRMGFLVGVEADEGLAQFCTVAGSAATGVANDCGQIDRMMLAGDDSFVFDRRDVFVQLSALDRGPDAGAAVTVRLLFADGSKVAITALVADRKT